MSLLQLPSSNISSSTLNRLPRGDLMQASHKIQEPQGAHKADRLPSAEQQYDSRVYPACASFIHAAVTTPGYCQALLRHGKNFAEFTKCELFELSPKGSASWAQFDDDQLLRHSRSTNATGKLGARVVPKLRILFFDLVGSAEASFGCQISMLSTTTTELLETLSINPHFVQVMLAKPNYLSPLSVCGSDSHGNTQHEFMCQYPRWYAHIKRQPCSVYISYGRADGCITYIVVSSREYEVIKRAKLRLTDFVSTETRSPLDTTQLHDPFFFSTILAQESLTESIYMVRDLRIRLYNQLDIVDTFALTPFDRTTLRNVTNTLHDISQNCESYVHRADMLLMIAQCMTAAHTKSHHNHNHNQQTPTTQNNTNNITASLTYLTDSIESQKRWLRVLTSRKDTAMNLVYNLVMQQDSITNTRIAQSTKEDSAVMRVIAILTMIYLPPMAVTGFFGMSFFDDPKDEKSNLWIFVAICVPLTLGTVGVWLAWWRWDAIRTLVEGGLSWWRRWISGVTVRRQGVSDVEVGNGQVGKRDGEHLGERAEEHLEDRDFV